MKAALYYYCVAENESDFLEQLLRLSQYARSIGMSPYAMYLDFPENEYSHPAYDQLQSDAQKGLFSIVVLYALPPHCTQAKGSLCLITLPKENH